MLVTLLALQIAAATPAPGSSLALSAGTDSATIVNRVRLDVIELLRQWRVLWETSEASRHDVDGGMFGPPRFARYGAARSMSQDRVNRLHCHPDGREGFPTMSHLIEERRGTLRAICPDWQIEPSGAAGDERLNIDLALTPSLRPAARAARGRVLAILDSAARSLPGDSWIAGQRVRFAVDQQDWETAARATRECRAAKWWCTALEGYMLHARGRTAAADSAFLRSASAMPPSDRCAWTDLTWLLDDRDQRTYRSVPCESRDSLNRRIWWLADPLYSEPGNDRRAEHFSRIVMVALRSAVEPAERWNWRNRGGGNALREMIVRYGWPSYTWWGGPGMDESHYGYLNIRAEAVQRLGVFTTAEYTQPRFHTMPDWSAVRDPWHASTLAWDLVGRPDRSSHDGEGWWPEEHYARGAGPLLPIDEEQSAFLRRHDALELAVATNLAWTGLPAGPGRTAQSTLVLSPSPDSLSFTTSTVPLDGTGVWRTMVPSRPAIVGLEVRSDAGPAVARARFGIDPPAPLSVMSPGDIAVSTPILMEPPSGTNLPDSDPRTALRSMLGTTRLRNMTRVGIYWETYGVPRGDSVDVAIAMERHDSPGVLRRLGTALHLVARRSTTVTIRWHEPAPGYVSTAVEGPEPIQARNVSIDLSRLEPDTYTVTVSVTRLGQTASASRDFEIMNR